MPSKWTKQKYQVRTFCLSQTATVKCLFCINCKKNLSTTKTQHFNKTSWWGTVADIFYGWWLELTVFCWKIPYLWYLTNAFLLLMNGWLVQKLQNAVLSLLHYLRDEQCNHLDAQIHHKPYWSTATIFVHFWWMADRVLPWFYYVQ